MGRDRAPAWRVRLDPRFDRLMEAAARTGVHVLGILDYSAPWARPRIPVALAT